MLKIFLAGSLIVAASAAALASVDSDLNTFFNKLGFEGNATGAAAWQGQAAGYVTG
ncbi:conjugal transfer protein TraH, partial [Klebsiella pneumoniae]|nr:conjugal transfer protein TraH [Klebsiella pneumoniae]